MVLVKRLPWILLGIVVGLGGAMSPRIVAQDRTAPSPLPIAIKFIGVLEKDNTRVAIFSDLTGHPVYAHEGETVLGRYKLLTVGVESVTLSYLDGTGVQQIPMARNQSGSGISSGVTPQQRALVDQVLTDHPAAGFSSWKFVSDSRTHSCWLAATNGQAVTALAPAPPDACR